MSDYQILAQDIAQTNYETEKANQSRAAKFYRDILIPKLESSIGSKCVKVQWYEYDGPGGYQSNGIDGSFQFENGITLYFQEKTHLRDTLASTTRWSTVWGDRSYAFEIVNHGGGIGWAGHIKNVNLLIIYYKDYVVVVNNENLSRLTAITTHGEKIYNDWFESGRPEKHRVTINRVLYRVNTVRGGRSTSTTMITNLPESVITDQLECRIKTYKA